jgi:hypothetical protein
MFVRRKAALVLVPLIALFQFSLIAATPPKKPHVVVLGAVRQVPYSKIGDPAGASPDEKTLRLRALLVDSRVSEWTTGDAHDITDRSFVVRRALRINDALPTDKPSAAPAAGHWIWQRGPWLLVDRVSGRVTALKLPDYDPGASQVAWFRDYAAYCGITSTGKSLYAVVAQIGTRKPVLAKKLATYDAENHPWPVCALPQWQREPLRIRFQPSSEQEPVSFDLVGNSAVLVEDGDDEASSPSKP